MRSLTRLAAAGCLLGLSTALAAAATPSMGELHGRTMGTTYSVKFWRPQGDADPKRVRPAIEALLKRFDRQMSTYRPDSELSRFAAATPGEWFKVSTETATATAHALEMYRLTDGASDVTIGPVLRVWRFGPGGAPNGGRAKPPSEAELQAAMKIVGADKLHARLDPPALRKDIANLEVDLSSMAPGYAIDLIVELLAREGYKNCIVELGGEVRASGTRPDGSPWRVGVESPPGADQEFARIVSLHNLALATSGDYRDVRTIDGVRYTHVIDPHIGRPLPYRGACVTVLAPTCLEADSLGTPLLVMGPKAGYQWCVNHDVAAIFQHRTEDDKFATLETPRLRQFIGQPEEKPHGATAE